MGISGLGYIGIGVSDIAHWRTFATTGVLGLQESEDGPDGTVYLRMEEFEKAIASYEKVLVEEPMHAGSLIAIGDVKVQQQKFDEAVVYFEKAIDQTEDEIVPFNVAEIYFNRGEIDRAIEFYKLAAERKPDWQDPLLKLAYANLNKGDMAAAKTALEACVAVAPDTVEGQTAAQMLQSPAFAN